MKPDRTGAFSDGVFAIAATLLVLEIHPPDPASPHLWRELAAEWPAFLGYAISFVTLGIAWVNHHALLEEVTEVDRTFLFLNLLLLLAVGFVPFPTGLLAAAFRAGAGEQVASVVYAATWLLVAGVFTLTWWYLAARAPDLLRHGAAFGRERLRRSWAGPALYAAALAAGFVWPPAALALFALVAIWFVFPGRRQGAPAGGSET